MYVHVLVACLYADLLCFNCYMRHLWKEVAFQFVSLLDTYFFHFLCYLRFAGKKTFWTQVFILKKLHLFFPEDCDDFRSKFDPRQRQREKEKEARKRKWTFELNESFSKRLDTIDVRTYGRGSGGSLIQKQLAGRIRILLVSYAL